MTEAPPETAKDRRRQWYVFFGLCVGLVALIGCLVLGALVHSDQQTINSKDTEIVTLLKQHSATFAAAEETNRSDECIPQRPRHPSDLPH